MNTPTLQPCSLGEAKIDIGDKTTSGVWKIREAAGKKVAAIYAEMSSEKQKLARLKLSTVKGKKAAKEYENFDAIKTALSQAGLNLEETADDKIWEALYSAIPLPLFAHEPRQSASLATATVRQT